MSSEPGIPPERINYDDLELDDELALLDGVPYTGVVYSLHRDGTVESESRYVDGLPDGLEEQWYSGGQLHRRIIALRGNGASEASSWYRNGQLRSVKRFVDRRMVEARAWDEAGNPIDPATLGEDNAFGVPVPGHAS